VRAVADVAQDLMLAQHSLRPEGEGAAGTMT
jgi:hypothetical protein